MPLYEYLCSDCAHQFERIVKFSDPPVTKCPKCGKETLEQMISAPAVQFKGSGWYVTDYAHTNGALGTSPSMNSDSSSESSKANSGNGHGKSNSASSGAPGKSNGNGSNASSGGNGANTSVTSNSGGSATSDSK